MKTDNPPFIDSLSSRRFFIRFGNTDFRWGIDMLASCAVSTDPEAVFSGSVFVFCSKSRNQVRFLFWEGSGWWLITRKVLTGRFMWPEKGDERSKQVLFKQIKTLVADPKEYTVEAKKVLKELRN